MTTTIADPALLETLTAGAAEVLPKGGLEAKLALGRPLRVKLGFDPTKPDLHLGHAVVLNALRRFQDAGHQVVVIIGDFTARIGDPTGKEATRPPLSAEDVKAHAETYLQQLGKIIDLSRAEIRTNATWLEPMGLTEVIQLCAHATVAQMLARENFAKRYERQDPIALHEFLYPLLQGQDSVAIQADVELGGTDQTFNLLMGRELQAAARQAPQVVMTFPILEGLDGVQKMSKSLGNTIELTDGPADMYGKTMSIPDALLPSWWRLASGRSPAEVEPHLASLAAGQVHPRDSKMALARAIVSLYHDEDAAREAEEGFVRQFQQRELPTDIPEVRIPASDRPLANLLVEAGLAASASEARRLVAQGGVKRHDGAEPVVLTDALAPVTLGPDPVLLQVGKRRFAKVFQA
ncbi:MAG: tyrosine--tRNA ligase [bacterium]|nr:tyrosine--tRNA ligase [bacterium]